MKILLMSDTHLGFSRTEDAFQTFEEGVERGLEMDAILLAGDVFDVRIPTTETFARAMRILARTRRGSGARIADAVRKDLVHEPQGIPVVAISGNHERRVKGLLNPVEALEHGGFLTHLHCNAVVLEKDGERVAVHGLSAVPHQYLAEVLKEWNPQPLPGCYNILVFHQNLEGFVRAPETLPRTSLPAGFDLYICGDIHEQHRSTVHGKPLILPGSTVATQVNKDACNPRTWVQIDTRAATTSFIPFTRQRAIYYEEPASREEADQRVAAILAQVHTFPPIIKIKAAFPPDGLEEKYGDRALLMIARDQEVQAVSIEQQALSAQVSGRDLLEKHLRARSLEPRVFHDVFELLANKQQDAALELLRSSVPAAPANGKAAPAPAYLSGEDHTAHG